VDLLKKIAETNAADCEKSLAFCRDARLRRSNPEKADEKKLSEALDYLRWSTADLERYWAACDQTDALEKLARDDNPQLEQEVQDAGDRWNAYVDETGKIIESRKKEENHLATCFRDLQQKQVRGRDAKCKLSVLARPAAGDTAGSESVQLIGQPKTEQDFLPSPDAPAPKSRTDPDGIPYAGMDQVTYGGEGGSQFIHATYEDLRGEFVADQRKRIKYLENLAGKGDRFIDEEQRVLLAKLQERYGQPAEPEAEPIKI